MKIFRPILSLILVFATTILVSCSGSTVSAPPTYTPDKLQKIATYRIPLDVARQRMSELGQYIDKEDWTNADNFLHGPLGLIRRDLTYLSKALLPDEQEPALNAAKDIFKHFENIDVAVDQNNYSVAIDQYKKVVSDLDAYSSLIPQTQKPVDRADQAMKSAKNVFKGVQEEVEQTVDRIEDIIPDFDENA
ncbi:photosystem II protein PsbQ [Waterburya agarophytonicola K14]|uniref:Photosystem II protein PsbQ n=1 Tax=Waterburya agarophytonicola KI4 TaxID=2874699 RepID=A0A964BPA0_9CYAN|nr:photosystem II protein PsbQ [Waterburya agarophytonicola]MCC0176910.1 photosystem II protein PsbQ [Waterburya agarophytonicola KI4]